MTGDNLERHDDSQPDLVDNLSEKVDEIDAKIDELSGKVKSKANGKTKVKAKPQAKSIEKYSNNPDWNRIIGEYFNNPSDPDFAKSGYADVSFQLVDDTSIEFRWGRRRLLYDKSV